MTERGALPAQWDWISPSAERLIWKVMDLEKQGEELRARALDNDQVRILDICDQYIRMARNFLDRPAISWRFPFFSRKHPHLVWALLHRVDEHYISLMSDDELVNKAIEVRTAFDLNIKEGRTRDDWIGPQGRLVLALDSLHQKTVKPGDRNAVKQALRIVNEQVDRKFWQLSANTLTNVWSALMLGVLMWVIWRYHASLCVANLGTGSLEQHYVTLGALGLIGAYLSNLLTMEDFLYVRGAPFVRYWMYNVLAKPLVGAMAAVLIYVVEKSRLIFVIGASGNGESAETASQLITVNVATESLPYVYALLAITAGFAADKLLRSTFDSVLKRLAKEAEKTSESAEKT